MRITCTLGRGGGVSRMSEGSFLRLKDGSILFALCRFTDEMGHDDGACDLAYIVSKDEGESWSQPEILLRAKEFGVSNIMSVSLLRMQNEDLGLFFLVKENDGSSNVVLARSKDEGQSFYRFIRCTLKDRPSYYVINNDRVERLPGGRLILPLAYHRSGFDENGRSFTDWRSVCVFLISDDDAETWREARDLVYPPFTDCGAGLQEPCVVWLHDSTLFMYARTDKYCQYGAYSFDAGEHWTAAQPTVFTSPCSPMKIARDPYSKKLCAVWNPIPNYCGREIVPRMGGRTPLVYAVSADDGVSWSKPHLIEGQPDHGYCYPALFFTRDQSLLCAYCAGGPADVHCLSRTNIAKIALGED